MIPTLTILNDLTNHQVSLTITQLYSDRFGRLLRLLRFGLSSYTSL